MNKTGLMRLVVGILLAMIIASAVYVPLRLPLAIAAGTSIAVLVTAANLFKGHRLRSPRPDADGEAWANRFTLDPP